MKYPDMILEMKLLSKGFCVVGIDEVGRGALAGPIGVGGFCLTGGMDKSVFRALEKLKINDSKLVSEYRRDLINRVLLNLDVVTAVSFVSSSYIDRNGIISAFDHAVRGCLQKIETQFESRSKVYVLLDAFNVKYLKGVGLKNQSAIVKGDRKCLTIAAASIVAKVARDSLMKDLAIQYPQFGWERNKGYGTDFHMEALKKYGVSKWHRISFLKNISYLPVKESSQK